MTITFDNFIYLAGIISAILTVARVVVALKRVNEVNLRIYHMLEEESRPNGGTSVKDLLTCIAGRATDNHNLLVEIKDLLRDAARSNNNS